MEQRSRTRQLLPASRFHPRQFRTYNGEISLVFCTITCEGSAASTVTASPFRLFLLFFQVNSCPLSTPKGKEEDARIPRPWGESRISLRKQSFLLRGWRRACFSRSSSKRNAKSFGFLSSSRTFESKEKIYTSKNESIGNRLFRFYIIHHLL